MASLRDRCPSWHRGRRRPRRAGRRDGAPLVAAPRLTFLKPKRRVAGLATGTIRSTRRGLARRRRLAALPPRRRRQGDRLGRLARLSRARGQDEFVVREHFADEAPRIVVVARRSPSMSLYPPGWPWLDKPAAVRSVLRLVGDSAPAARATLLPRSRRVAADEPADAARADRGLRGACRRRLRGLEELVRHRRRSRRHVRVRRLGLPPAAGPGAGCRVLGRRLDAIPVVVQDRSGGRASRTWRSRRCRSPSRRLGRRSCGADQGRGGGAEARERAAPDDAATGLRGLDLEPVLVESSGPHDVLRSFLAWVDRRRARR